MIEEESQGMGTEQDEAEASMALGKKPDMKIRRLEKKQLKE